MSATTKFYFKPGDNELIQTIVHIRPEIRSAIKGFVLDLNDQPVEDAVVMLFESPEDDAKLITQTFTDDSGMFFFGPLDSGRLYLIKIYKDMVKIRELEIRPDKLKDK